MNDPKEPISPVEAAPVQLTHGWNHATTGTACGDMNAINITPHRKRITCPECLQSVEWIEPQTGEQGEPVKCPSSQPVACRCECLIFVRANGTIVPHWNDPDIHGDQAKCAMNDKQWCDCHLHHQQVCDICQGVAGPQAPSPVAEGAGEPPAIGSIWKHRNGNTYRVILIANDKSERAEYPPMVIYQGENGNIWARRINDWSRSFMLTTEPQPEPTKANELDRILSWQRVEGKWTPFCPHNRRANSGCVECGPDAPLTDEVGEGYWRDSTIPCDAPKANIMGQTFEEWRAINPPKGGFLYYGNDLSEREQLVWNAAKSSSEEKVWPTQYIASVRTVAPSRPTKEPKFDPTVRYSNVIYQNDPNLRAEAAESRIHELEGEELKEAKKQVLYANKAFEYENKCFDRKVAVLKDIQAATGMKTSIGRPDTKACVLALVRERDSLQSRLAAIAGIPSMPSLIAV